MEYLPCGKVYIYWGSAAFDVEPDVILDGSDYANDSWGLMFGNRIDTSGDFNGDGINDLVVSSCGPSLLWNGQVDIFYGSAAFNTQADWHKQGTLYQYFGTTITAGNLNGDAYDDLAVAWNEDTVNPGDVNRLGIFQGSSNMDTDADVIITNATSDSIICLGHRTCMNGDLNNDGYDDLVYAQMILDRENRRAHDEACIMLGNSDLNLQYWATIEYPRDADNIFYTDINNDGIDDLASNDQIDTLLCFNFFCGSNNFDLIPDYVVMDTDAFGLGCYGFDLGDINGDHQNDVCLSNLAFDESSQWYMSIYTAHYLEACEPLAPQVQASYSLYNYPNPFNPETTIGFSVPQGIQNPVVEIFNVKGQKIRSLPCRQHRSIRWDGRNQCAETVASGVYFYRVQAENYQSPVRKMLLLK